MLNFFKDKTNCPSQIEIIFVDIKSVISSALLIIIPTMVLLNNQPVVEQSEEEITITLPLIPQLFGII